MMPMMALAMHGHLGTARIASIGEWLDVVHMQLACLDLGTTEIAVHHIRPPMTSLSSNRPNVSLRAR